MRRVVRIGETTKDIVKSFNRNDARIRRNIASKYGRRKKHRIKNIINQVSKIVVEQAKEKKQAIVFEDIRNIRKLYRRGNGKGKDYRRMMNNHWSFAEVKRQIEYKATWLGVPVVYLTRNETRGTSQECYVCGERLQETLRDDVLHKRELWCEKCAKWFDRDLVAVMNISRKGWVRFAQSKGLEIEAMKRNPNDVVILRVDPSKWGQRGVSRSFSFLALQRPNRTEPVTSVRI